MGSTEALSLPGPCGIGSLPLLQKQQRFHSILVEAIQTPDQDHKQSAVLPWTERPPNPEVEILPTMGGCQEVGLQQSGCVTGVGPHEWHGPPMKGSSSPPTL